jgi:hypothetical protein
MPNARIAESFAPGTSSCWKTMCAMPQGSAGPTAIPTRRNALSEPEPYAHPKNDGHMIVPIGTTMRLRDQTQDPYVSTRFQAAREASRA